MSTSYIDLRENYEDIFESMPANQETEIPNFFSIAGIAHLEDILSNIYAFFFSSEGKHGLNDLFIKSLCEIISEKTGEDFTFNKCSCIREKGTNKGGSIDMVLYDEIGDDQFHQAIIVENKIYASLFNDLSDYYDSINSDEDSKIGIVLSLQRIVTNNSKFTNILHQEMIQKVSGNMGHYIHKANDKYWMFLKEFIDNTNSYYTYEKMDDSIKFCMNYGEKISGLIALKQKAEGYLIESIKNNIPDVGWLYQRAGVNNYSITIQREDISIVIYIYLYEIFNNKKFKIEMWLKGKDFINRWYKSGDINSLKDNKIGISISDSKSNVEWFKIGEKTYNIVDEKDLENFGLTVKQILANDWNGLIEIIKK